MVTSAVSNAQGIYLLPFLPPGKYTVSAELMGFKKHVREGIEVRIADRLTLDLALEVGQLEEVISVRAESPLLDMRSASQGQVIDERRIALLPLSDGNAFTLARLAPGIAYTGDLKFSRAFDNGGTSGIVSDGASGGNEFTLDGTPNMANGRRVAFVPPAGAVSEFKVETASFDAQQGHTAGATVNVAIKSGTNNLKGEGYWYYRDDKLSKNDFFLETAGRPKAEMSYDRFGGFAGGPILKNRTFFFGAVEWLYDEFPEPGPVHRADREDAQRRLLGAARRRHHHLRSGDGGPARRWPHRTPAVPGQHHPGQPHQPDRPQLPAVLAGCPTRPADASSRTTT